MTEWKYLNWSGFFINSFKCMFAPCRQFYVNLLIFVKLLKIITPLIWCDARPFYEWKWFHKYYIIKLLFSLPDRWINKVINSMRYGDKGWIQLLSNLNLSWIDNIPKICVCPWQHHPPTMWLHNFDS